MTQKKIAIPTTLVPCSGEQLKIVHISHSVQEFTVQKLRLLLGESQSNFSKRYGVPVDTLKKLERTHGAVLPTFDERTKRMLADWIVLTLLRYTDTPMELKEWKPPLIFNAMSDDTHFLS